MKNIIAVMGKDSSFDSVFQKESPFIKKEKYWTYMLKEELQKIGYCLLPFERINEVKKYEAFLHFARYRKDIIKKYIHACHIYIAFEPKIVVPAHKSKSIKKLVDYVFDAIVTTRTDMSHERVYSVRFPVDMNYFGEDTVVPDKLACMFCGDKAAFGKELYSLRRKVITYSAEKKVRQRVIVDFFGPDWGKPYCRYKNYMGRASDKLTAAAPYRFIFCFENEWHGAVTEKIFDALIAGKVPVYLGADNITDYVPQDCFIDYSMFHSVQECIDFLSHMPEKEYQSYLTAIRGYTTDKKVKEQFSAADFAQKLDIICKLGRVHKKRRLRYLAWYMNINRIYRLFCKLKRFLIGITEERIKSETA